MVGGENFRLTAYALETSAKAIAADLKQRAMPGVFHTLIDLPLLCL